MTIPTNQIMRFNNIFWQYPVLTEKIFYDEMKEDSLFIGFPWATLIDKHINLQEIYELFSVYIDKSKHYYTCCQHIYFYKLIPFFKALNIKTVYSPHKTNTVDKIDNVEIKPCPIYAVNIEDPSRNTLFKNCDLIDKKRTYLYSFIGAYNSNIYISNIRDQIYCMEHPSDCFIEKTNSWFYESIVYNNQQNNDGTLNKNADYKKNTQKFNKLLLESRFSLCPSGSGPNSIRFWESLGCGSIPILLSDTLELPSHPLWDSAILRVNENKLQTIPSLLKNISNEDENNMRKKCLILYNHFRKLSNCILCIHEKKQTTQNYSDVIHYCCGKYPNVGGVPRFDLQISIVFPNRKFFYGPQEKEKMLHYLSRCKNPIVITDNHLACDIPNTYNVILVHHGCARTTSERNPDWDDSWKSLCTKGQEKMLTFRDPAKTKIVSISQSCTDDFTKYYGSDYTKFERIKLLHSSELDESRYKTSFNKNPVVLGNWRGIKKGERLLPKLISSLKEYHFAQLNVYPEGDYKEFNNRKQDIYLKSDIFLQISNSEGNSYATLDALLCGMVVVASDVGLFYKDVPDDCFVRLDWKRNGDVDYVRERLEYAWEHRDELSQNARKWYMENCRFSDWEKKFKKIIEPY
tara:strand:+ start:7530 stop:9422 length:1893 start_codon:yes stop_codon:yes gene_type:complete